jgi:antitoxin CptB
METSNLENKAPSLTLIRWQCRRGMLELDLFLAPFAEAQYERLTDNEQKQFAALLAEEDHDLFNWLMGQPCPQTHLQALLTKIRNFKCKHLPLP